MQNDSGATMADNATVSAMSGHRMPAIGTAELAAEATLLVVSMVLAVVSNSVMCAVLYTRRRNMSSSYVLLFNMAVAGLVFAVCVMPLHAYAVFTGVDWSGSWVCSMDGHIIAICTLATLVTHVFIAVTRCTTVTAPASSCAMVVARGRLLVVASWMIAVTLDVVGAASDVIHPGYSATYRMCIPFDMLHMDGVLVSLAAVVGITFFVMCYCYVRLILTVRRQVKKLKESASDGCRLRRDIDVTRTLILLGVLYVTGWLPMLLVSAFDRDHTRFHLTWHRLAHDVAEVMQCLYPFFCMSRIAELRVTARDMMFCSSNRNTIRKLIVSVSKVTSGINLEPVAPRFQQQLSVQHLRSDRGRDV
ncbi:hypothetical protein LSAT2_012564 [Lamellibrachia satsuma]|nr:hypothetical protein LSAT2_012564 [Lamellibrachia satsuma]